MADGKIGLAEDPAWHFRHTGGRVKNMRSGSCAMPFHWRKLWPPVTDPPLRASCRNIWIQQQPSITWGFRCAALRITGLPANKKYMEARKWIS